MIFIGGISQGRKDFDFFRQTIVCKKCGRYSSISVFMIYTYFSFFFIPLFKWGKSYYAISNCCNTVFSIDQDLGKAIENGENIQLTEADLTIVGMDHSRTNNCPDCGYLLTSEYSYCPKCGRKI